MKTVDHKFSDERHVIKPDGEHDGLEELGLLGVILVSLTMLGFIALAVFVMCLQG